MHSGLRGGEMNCEIVEVSSLEDALGTLCGRYAVSTCTDCGNNLCISHAEPCHICHKVFCGACLGFQLDGHAKPAKRLSRRTFQIPPKQSQLGTVNFRVLRVLKPGGRFLFIEHVAAPWGTGHVRDGHGPNTHRQSANSGVDHAPLMSQSLLGTLEQP